MRRALVVGINYYEHLSSLFGCVRDATEVAEVLKKHGDGSRNFDVLLHACSTERDRISRSVLRVQIEQLFRDETETALFYFAGHGHIEPTGGYILDSDSRNGNDGIPLSDVLNFAIRSPAKNRIIVLDSCFSGNAGVNQNSTTISELSEGMTILTASTSEQYAQEENGSGVFTTLFVDALNGAAANLLGDVTPGSIYAHIDQSLGAWDQRPVFKTNVKNFVSLRKVMPTITVAEFQLLLEFFPSQHFDFRLDPSFEPERTGQEISVPEPDPVNTAKFALLQKFNRVNLVVPVAAPHMWHAAMQSKSCRLTVLGEHFRNLVERGRI